MLAHFNILSRLTKLNEFLNQRFRKKKNDLSKCNLPMEKKIGSLCLFKILRELNSMCFKWHIDRLAQTLNDIHL